MRIRITSHVGYTNPARGIELKFNQVVEVDDHLAAKLLIHHIAEPDPPLKVETVAKQPPENTAKRVSKPRTRKGPQ